MYINSRYKICTVVTFIATTMNFADCECNRHQCLFEVSHCKPNKRRVWPQAVVRNWLSFTNLHSIVAEDCGKSIAPETYGCHTRISPRTHFL